MLNDLSNFEFDFKPQGGRSDQMLVRILDKNGDQDIDRINC